MEYLMTYGWSILLLAVVLAALFELGIFSGKSTLPTLCIAQSGFLCSAPLLNTTGNLIVTVGQALGAPITITGLGCSSTSAAPSSYVGYSNSMVSGQESSITFQCPLPSNTIGTFFSGSLWLRYTRSGVSTASEVATITAKATTTSALGGSGGGGGTYLYVTNYGSNNVVIINTATNTVTGAITSGSIGQPYGVAFSPNGNYAYVECNATANVVVINTTTNAAVNEIISGAFTYELAYEYYGDGISVSPTGSYAYYANSYGGNVLIIDTATNTVSGAVTNSLLANSYPQYVAFSPSGTYAYVTVNTTSEVIVISTATGNVVSYMYSVSSGLNQPEGIAVSPGGSDIYVANCGAGCGGTGGGNGNVVVIDASNGQAVNAISSGMLYPSGVALSSNGEYLYVLNSGSSNVVVINTVTNAVVNAITSGFSQPSSIAIS